MRFKIFIIFYLIFSFLLLANTSGQKNKFDYALVPDSLTKNADAIIRKFVTEVNRQNIDKMTHRVFKAITVLNEKGNYDARLNIPYDNLSKVGSLTGRIYNSIGALVKTMKMNDFYDSSSYSDFFLFSDNRAKMYAPNIKEFPYTIEFEYEVSYNGFSHIETWMPVHGEGLAVEEAVLRFTTDPGQEYKTKSGNYPFEYKKEIDAKNFEVHEWKLANFNAIKSEHFMPKTYSVYPYLLLVPVQFKYDGFSGSLASWNSLGAWSGELLKNRMDIGETTILKIKELTYDLPSDREKVKAVYQYMQNKTRYVAVSLGIGGYQPVLANDVDKYGYGDCKALSNYTMTLLAAIDIPSYYTIIGAGDATIRFPDFASLTQANHVILTVPLENDTVWLECTNPHIPFGYVGDGIANRKALLVNNDGGELIDMPRFTSEENVVTKKAGFVLHPDGNATGTVEYLVEGLMFESLAGLKVATEKDQRDYLLRTFPLNNLQIESFNVTTEGEERTAIARLEMSFKAGKYGDVSGNRLFVPLNKVDRSKISFKSKKERMFDIMLPSDETRVVNAQFKIPDGYEVDYLPKAETVDSPYGTYSCSCELQDGKIKYTRKLVLKSGTYKKENYTEIYDFFDKVSNLDNSIVVLKKI